MSLADDEEPLPPEQEAELLAALEAALRPAELDPQLNERLIEMALEDPLAPPSEQELVESARLRDALEQGRSHEDLAMLAALRLGAAQPSADEAAVERALHSALSEHSQPAHESRSPGRAGRGNVVYAVFGAASAVLAAAAVVALFVGTGHEAAPVAAAYAKPRTTAPLFNERFETGETTARIDLIASARSRDLRDNRYASWGVR